MSGILVRPAAAADIEDAYRWYERQRRGLGEEFLIELQRTMDSIETAPQRFAVLHRETRRALLRRFPYGVFFRIADEQIVVVACMHGSREPRTWKRRR